MGLDMSVHSSATVVDSPESQSEFSGSFHEWRNHRDLDRWIRNRVAGDEYIVKLEAPLIRSLAIAILDGTIYTDETLWQDGQAEEDLIFVAKATFYLRKGHHIYYASG